METILLGLIPPLTVLLAGLVMRVNGRPKKPNPHNPNSIRLGDMSVDWWEQRHQEVLDELRTIRVLLERRRR